MSQPIIELKGLTKRFEGADTVLALENIDLTVEAGQIYGVIGLSGAGKSTLVRCMNLLEKPTAGTVTVDGKLLTALSEKELRAVRKSIGMIFQHFNLLMQRTCLQNITFPLELVGTPKKEAEQRARELLKIVDLESKADAYPAEAAHRHRPHPGHRSQGTFVRRGHLRPGSQDHPGHPAAHPGHQPSPGHHCGHHHPRYEGH